MLSGGKLTIGSGAALTNGNVLNNGCTVEINQGGKLVNDVVLNNSGTIQVDGEPINNGTINNTGTIVNNGTLSGNPVTGVTPDDPKLPDSCAFTVTGGVYGTDYTYENNTLKILTETALTIEGKSGVTNTDKILVARY